MSHQSFLFFADPRSTSDEDMRFANDMQIKTPEPYGSGGTSQMILFRSFQVLSQYL